MNGTSDMADGAIDANGGLVFELNAVAPECDGTIWVSNDNLGVFEGYGFAFLSNPRESTSPARPFIPLLIYRYCPLNPLELQVCTIVMHHIQVSPE